QLASEGERLQAQKLSALAEFAAGAGHEINNPLAVISGQAQYLLKKVTSNECRAVSEDASSNCQLTTHHSPLTTSLNTIIQQQKRIHQILTELRKFAGPPRPQKEAVDLAGLVREVAATLHESATRGQVEIICPEPAQPVSLYADPQQLRT